MPTTLALSLSSQERKLAVSVLANLCAGKDRDIVTLLGLGVLSAFEQYYVESQTTPEKNMIVWALANICAVNYINEAVFEAIKHPVLKRIVNDATSFNG